MPIRALNHFMIGDTMANDNPHLRFSNPIDKFKNDHLQCMDNQKEPETIQTNIPSLPTGLPQRNPNTFRHWAEPPPPPARTRKIEKKMVQIKKRPGSADPRFRRHLSQGESNLITQSDPKIKKNVLLNDANTLQQPADPPLHPTNEQISHVNEWLQSQLSSNLTNEQDLECCKQNNSKSSSKSNVDYNTKFVQTNQNKDSILENLEKIRKTAIIKINQFTPRGSTDNLKNDTIESDSEKSILEGEDYQETLKITSNDLVHKFPDYSKQSRFGSGASEGSLVSELTDPLLMSGSAPCLDTISKISLVKNKGRLEQVVEYYEKSDTEEISPLLETNDSQLNLMCANPEANGFFYKTIPYSLSWPNRNFFLFVTAGILFTTIGVMLSSIVPLQEGIEFIYKSYFGEPEESFFDKYVFGFNIDATKSVVNTVFDKILHYLVMPVNARNQ